MDTRTLIAIFATVFLAELGDKTQLATVLFASNAAHRPLWVFAAASAALLTATAIAVVAGSLLSNYVNTRYLSLLAGVGFIVIGAGTLPAGHPRASP
jgi:putative Ca2+/H+ antiporter (TMEM165/GDT1 family)